MHSIFSPTAVGTFGLLVVLGTPAFAQQGPIATTTPTITQKAAQNISRQGLDRLMAINIADTLGKTTTAADDSGDPLAAACLADAKKADPTIVSFGCYWLHLRASSPQEADAFFGGLETLNSMALTVGNKKSAALYTELLSDNIWIGSRLGFARVGFSAQVETQADSAKPTVEQFFQGGGNAVLYAAKPLMSWMNYFGLPNEEKKLFRRVDVFLTGALAGDIPKLAAEGAVSAASGRAGAAMQGYWAANKSLFRFFGDGNVNYVHGFSDGFYDNLVAGAVEKKGFVAASASVGVDLAQLVRVGVRFSGSTLDGLGTKPQVTFQMLKQK